MAKGKSKVKIEGNTISGNAEDIVNMLNKVVDKEVKIKSASLKDEFCNYSYEHKMGATAGDECSRDGAHVVHDDLKAAFSKLKVHYAFLDDAYLNGGHNVSDIDEWHVSEITDKYFVTGFKLAGSGENESIIISGGKQVTFGWVSYPAPKILFAGTYPFINELRVVVDDCLNEVYKYLHGKAAPKLVQSDIEFPENNSEGVE